MAKFRFPGKALKLNYRKRVRFRYENEIDEEDPRVLQIKEGFFLFRQLFGESDEDDEFEGFTLHESAGIPTERREKNGCARQRFTKNTKRIVKVESLIDERGEKEENFPPKTNESSLILAGNGSEQSFPFQEETVINEENDEAELQVLVEEKIVVEEKSCETLAKKTKKVPVKENVCVISDRTSKKFVLPTVSVRSSRIIKPNKRLFDDFTPFCSTQAADEICKNIPPEIELSSPKPVRARNNDQDPDRLSPDQNEKESDPVCRSITFYTNSITEQFKGHVGRPPKKPSHRWEGPPKEEFSTASGSSSPVRAPKEVKVKEKIEKLLRSPWDNRLKQNSSKVCGKDKEKGSLFTGNNSLVSKSILRKARLNLNKQTLQKIRSPASVQRLVPLSEEDTAERKCGLCQNCSLNTVCRYGVSCCEACHMSINSFTEGLSSNLECCGGQGECQLVGLSFDERCEACWLCRILLTCAMPSLLHDRLRKQLPTTLREKVPTSLGRSFNVKAIILPEGDFNEADGSKIFTVDSSSGGFGSHVDLPGGWKRKTGSEVVVISPSGEKFRSVSKLDEYLKRLGINAEASVLFGSLTNKNTQNTEPKSLPKLSMKSNKINNVVVTTLPGGWTRRIKWRSTGDRFDTYVCSPDGRTFRSCRELSAYFQRIGKIDDIHKYFPVRNASTSRANSSENSEASSTEPASSSEAGSEESLEDKSPSASDSESDECNFRLNTPVRNSVVRNSDEKGIQKLMSDLKKKLENDAYNLKLEKMKWKTKSEMENRKAEPKFEKRKVKPEIENKQAKSEIENIQAKPERENRKEKSEFGKRKAKPEKESRNVELESHYWNTEPVMENMKSTREMESRKTNQEIENRMTNPEIEKWKITNEIKDGKRKPENENRKTKPGIENWKEKMRIRNRYTEYKNANDCGKLESDDSVDSDYESKVNKSEIKQGKTVHSSGKWDVSQSKKNVHLSSVIIKNLDNKIHQKINKSSFNDKQDLTVVFQAGKKGTSQVDNFNKGINRNIIDLNSYGKAQVAANENGLIESVNEEKFLHSNLESDEDLEKSESSLDEGQKFVLQIKKHGCESPGNDNGMDPIRKHKKRKKKKKRKHEKHLKEKIVKGSSQSLLICDVDKIVANLNECKENLNKSSEKKSPIVKSLASSFFADTSYLSSDIPCHPNDTWQTLISNSFLEMKDSIDLCDESIPDITNNTEREELDVPGETELNQNKISTEPSIVVSPTKVIIPVQLKDKSQKKVKKQSPFTTEHFANGWSRKIKWNDKGCGKVSFLTSPDGQKIVSSIELLAYFKKAGKPVLNISYYFPKDIVRDVPQIEEVNTENETAREDPQVRLTPAITDPENNEGKLLKGKKILSRQPKKLSRRALKLLKVPGRKMSMRSKLSLDESNQLLSDGGPRVKHVCRSQAQVLGMPRAVFPSPDKEEKPKVKTVLNSSLTMAPTSFISPGKEDKTRGKKVLHSSGKKAKFLTVATPTGRKILKKTLWCNKCSGCTTPNCRKCSNCKDMKKYGGPGTKKKPCVMRKCHNPFKAIKASSTEETFAEEKEKVTVGGKASASQTSCESIVLSSLPLSAIDGDSESDIKANLTADSADDLRKDIVSEEEYLPSIEKSIFIPKLMRHSYEVKDRGDVQAGKECNPGARVNIDYWQGYEAEEMLISGFPIITSVPLQYDSLCFRCGSAGMEQLLYCIWCCEGVHPFCLEEGEGPDSDEQEALWVCRKCAVCHVCGGPGHDNLLQCSGCRKHYHLECLGPSSHIACQAPAESSWLCVRCIKCHGCSSPNVVNWIDIGSNFSDCTTSPNEESAPELHPFCVRCLELRHSKNFCPICHGCYEDDDFDSKMMECGRCKEWVHSRCEGLSDECYQILTFLPDSVEFVCKLCLKDEPALWKQAVRKELVLGIKAILNALINSRCSKHLVRLDDRTSGIIKRNDMAYSAAYMRGKKHERENEQNSEIRESSLFIEQSSLKDSPVEKQGHDILSETEIKSSNTKLTAAISNNNTCDKKNVHSVETCSKPGIINTREAASMTTAIVNSITSDFFSKKENINTCIEPECSLRPLTRSLASNSQNKDDKDVKLKECSVQLLDICKSPFVSLVSDSKNSSTSVLNVSSMTSTFTESNLNNGLYLSNCASACDNCTKSPQPQHNFESLQSNNCDLTINQQCLESECDKNFSSNTKIHKLDFDSEVDSVNSLKEKKQMTPYTPSARVSKDIDDDCLSSEESSFCSSDTELESIFDDPEEPKDLLEIKTKINEEKYRSLLQFHVDIVRIMEAGRNLNKTQTRNCKLTYTKHMREQFPWFDIHRPNIFSLVDCMKPFPFPYADHNYSDIKVISSNTNAHNFISRKPFTRKESMSPLKSLNFPLANQISPSNWPSSTLPIAPKDLRKCILCNIIGDADPNASGRLLYLGQDEWLHVNCGLWSSEVYEEEDGGLQNVYVAVSRGRQIKCNLCLERGATIGCCHRTCQATYHFMCAKKSNCFFGEDKRIFCHSHSASAGNQKAIEDLRVGRCVFVNMDSEKKRWRQALSINVNVVIGSLSIVSLGKMVPDIDYEDALIPVDFSCSRIYWSTKDPTQRVKYTCRTRKVNPNQVSLIEGYKSAFHKTVDHSMEPDVVEREMAAIREWQKELERQKWERQSRQTNIIPTHMCPLYRKILKVEKNRTERVDKFNTSIRRQLFSPLSSNCSLPTIHDENEEEMKMRVEDIVPYYSDRENMLQEADIPNSLSLDDADIISNIAPVVENSEIMTSIVNADDNEIISMVLRDLGVLESSALHSTPSTSGRPSPLDLDFLATCDQGMNQDEEIHDDPTLTEEHEKSMNSQEQLYQEIAIAKSTTDANKVFPEEDEHSNADAQLICQRIFEACDPQMQNQILTLEQEQNPSESVCNSEALCSLVSSQTVDHSVSFLQTNLEESVANVAMKSLSDPVSLPQHGSFQSSETSLQTINETISQPVLETISQSICQAIPSEISAYGAQFLNTLDKDGPLHYLSHSVGNGTSHSEDVMHDMSFCNVPVSSSAGYCNVPVSSAIINGCHQDVLEFKDFILDAGSKIHAKEMSNVALFDSTLETLNESYIHCEPLPSHIPTSSSSYKSLASIVSGIEEEREKDTSLHQNQFCFDVNIPIKKTELEFGTQPIFKESTDSCSTCEPFSLPLLPNVSSLVSASLCSTSKKQVCRVLPMLSSVGSRRTSSASDQSDANIFLPNIEVIPPPVEVAPVAVAAESTIVEETPVEQGTDQRKRKIRMKRNYRTVIKKYPLRSAFRKHTPYKTVQIEINETIEIPSEDDETLCRRSLKRKWSGEVIESKGNHSQNEHSTPKEISKSKRRVFRSSNPSLNKKDIEHSLNMNDHTNDPQNDTKSDLARPGTRSHQVLKFSDNHNAITVSIVNNNNLCDFAKRKRRHRYRRKTVLQLDGAADDSASSSEGSDELEEENLVKTESSPPLTHSNLALHIKQQSLARSSPGEEGPYKCSKCKRLYRTRDSYNRHIETCTFEIDSSTTSEDDVVEKDAEIRHPAILEMKQEFNTMGEYKCERISPVNEYIGEENVEDSNFNCLPNGNMDLEVENHQQCNETENITNLKKLEEMCSSSILDNVPSLTTKSQEEKGANCEMELSRTPGVHRQVRTAMKRSSDSKISIEENCSTLEGNNSINVVSTIVNEVFVPPVLSPMKFSPTVKKSASPRRYTNVRLFKGRQGYQYRRAPPQLLSPQPPQFQPFQPNQLHLRGQQTHIPLTLQPIMDQNSFSVHNSAFPSPQQYQNSLNHTLSQLNGEIGVRGPVVSVGQVMTVVSGPSVAVPQGYTLQYVGSFREGEIGSTTNLLTYQTPQQMVLNSPIVVTPQPTPVVMPQVVNTNITYTIAAPETLVINQPTAVVPSVQYVTQHQQHPFQQQMIQPIGTMMPYSSSPVPSIQHLNSSFTALPVASAPVAMQQLVNQENISDSNTMSIYGHNTISLTSASPSFSSSTVSFSSPASPRNRPQALIAPICTVSEACMQPRFLKLEASPPSSSRPLFSQTPPVSRSVATVAPAVFTATVPIVSRTTFSQGSSTHVVPSNAAMKDVYDTDCSIEDVTPLMATVRPRPTYSYRDAMKGTQQERKRSKQDTVVNEMSESSTQSKSPTNSDGEEQTEIEKDEEKQNKDKVGLESITDVQSYKLILRKDSQSGSKFNVLPLTGPNVPLPSPEVKELRIKAKVSVGPKRKKASGSIHKHWGQSGKDFILASKDTTNDLLVNEQTPNLSLNLNSSPLCSNDSSLMDKPKAVTPEPYIVFELTSDDGFKVESRHVSEVWQKVFDAVSEARDNLRLGVKSENVGTPEAKGKSLSGLHMLGLTHNAVQYLLEQLPGAKDCHKYSFQFHRRPTDDDHFESASGCVRSEAFKTRSPYDIFSWLASKHRRLPKRTFVQPEEIMLSTRRATSLELPMAMRYRHLCETAREAVGVFRSSIHGRGLFCKREIDSGEMVIEYAGQVIRSCLCDMREKYYESKGIGCYMFRIDEETVIDATMHGNAARFINHSCDPNCYSRVVDILGKKHIIIFALRRIQRGEELTYDYKFPIEDDKIPCSCGAKRCRKYLN